MQLFLFRGEEDDDGDDSYVPESSGDSSDDSEEVVKSIYNDTRKGKKTEKEIQDNEMPSTSHSYKNTKETFYKSTEDSSEKMKSETQSIKSIYVKKNLKKRKEMEQGKQSDDAKKTIFVKSSNTKDGKRAWDKRHFCVYCKQGKAKMARHLEDVHGGEPAVKRLSLLIPDKMDTETVKKDKKRLRLEGFEKLRKLGDFNHNYDVLKK